VDGFYGNVEERIAGNSLPSRGKGIILRLLVDSDHAGDQVTRRSRTGYLIYLNMAPIQWFSNKKQVSAETSVFGAVFVASRGIQ
jgi:hypothetical protein